MKKILLPLFTLFAGAAFAQADCDPMAHDFGDQTYGVYPDTTTGIAPGVVGQPYNQVIYILVPVDASVISPTFGAFATLNGISLAGVSYVNANGDTLDIASLGLTLECNPASCSFLPGEQYCGVISGTPNQPGQFPVIIEADVDVNVLGFDTTLPYDFGGYTYSVLPLSVPQVDSEMVSVEPAMPNPANNNTRITLNTPSANSVTVTMVNMVGERVLSRNFAGKRGENSITLDVAELPQGVYLYTIESGSFKTTRKLVIQH
ncbi:MAG: T9SS type A sorting domain-containing protein [Flavobacteriales bacterium]|jgi:hypothetical protein